MSKGKIDIPKGQWWYEEKLKMPYIEKEKRESVSSLHPESVGELNYLITRLCKDYYDGCGESYSASNAIIGVLECVKQEFYRRVTAPYEDKKMKENGDVY